MISNESLRVVPLNANTKKNYLHVTFGPAERDFPPRAGPGA